MIPPAARERRGIPLRALVPNAVTALALCSGLSGVRFALAGNWEQAVFFVLLAAVLDGLDGRIARMLRGQSRFGAELDSLSDVIAFGVSPAIIIYLWALQHMPRPGIGWVFALAYAVCAALRLARFNANIDVEHQPHKSAGFFTGVPAPAGAGLMLLPVYLSLASDSARDWLAEPYLIAVWTAVCAFLMVSNIATFSWTSMRLRRNVRFSALVVIAVVAGALVSAPWETLSLLAVVYAASIPFSIVAYQRVKRQRASGPRPSERPAQDA